jgi:hypothetical protein
VGVYGDGATDWKRFRNFVQDTTFSDWADLAKRCVPVLETCSGGKTFGAVFAGRLDGKSGARHLGEPTEVMCTTDGLFAATCRLSARVGWELSSLSNLDHETRFAYVMRTAIDASNGVLGTPYTMWRISPDGCDQVTTPIPPLPQGIGGAR